MLEHYGRVTLHKDEWLLGHRCSLVELDLTGGKPSPSNANQPVHYRDLGYLPLLSTKCIEEGDGT